MPYITAAQRYSTPRPVSPGKTSANLVPETMLPYTGSHNSAPLRNAYASHQKPSYSSYSYYPATSTAGRDEFGRDLRSHREDRYTQSEYQRYDSFERGQDSYRGYYQEWPCENSPYQKQAYWQRSGYQSSEGYRAAEYEARLKDSWRPGQGYQAVYPTAQTGQANRQGYIGQRHQYAPLNHQAQTHQQYTQATHQTQQHALTQQWRAAIDLLPQSLAGTQYNQRYNANATAFIPQQPVKYAPAKSKHGASQPGSANLELPPPPPPTPPPSSNDAPLTRYALRSRTPGTPSDYDSRSSSSPRSPNNLTRQRPEPSVQYLKQASGKPRTIDNPRPLLVVLDLNGTLLHRPRRGANFVSRPKVNEFLHYLTSNHNLMIWSSAKPENVTRMCDKLFTKDQKDKLVAIWARDKLRLSKTEYNEKVQVYKQLTWVWKDKQIQSANPNPVDYWSQENTVLIDDSMEKAASEPCNIVQVEEFEGKRCQMEADVLGQVVKYMQTLRSQQDVSAYMDWKPFAFDPGDSFDWTEIVNDMH